MCATSTGACVSRWRSIALSGHSTCSSMTLRSGAMMLLNALVAVASTPSISESAVGSRSNRRDVHTPHLPLEIFKNERETCALKLASVWLACHSTRYAREKNSFGSTDDEERDRFQFVRYVCVCV